MVDNNETSDPAGFDTARVEQWISQHVDGLAPPLTWQKLDGGHSNLTYRIVDTNGREAVIRRPPMGELLPGAHDMAREFSIISALQTTAVPVAPAIGFCEDPSVTGAHFYIMGVVQGNPLYTTQDAKRHIASTEREQMAHSFVDVLADLHAVDPDAVGLGTLARKEDYIGRQLKTWYRSWTASVDGAQLDDPRAHALREFLIAKKPAQESARVVHGDYGVHNCLFGTDGRVAAVLDWEISTLGDPLADLGYALNQWAEPDDPVGPRGPGPTSVPGFPDRKQMAARYQQKTGRDLTYLDYYLGFNFWKSAAIKHGVYARYQLGKKSRAGVDMPAMRQSILDSLAAAEQALGRL